MPFHPTAEAIVKYPTPRGTYLTPKLTVHGDVREITHAIGLAGAKDLAVGPVNIRTRLL